jgi:lipoprotein-releasing system ATP-binding protein
MLKGKNIYKSFDNIEVLKDINIEIERGKIVSIVGKSGAGKSTLLYILSTLDKATNGEVLFDNKKLDELKGDDLSNFRNKKIGFIFQFHNLLSEFSVLENVSIPALISSSDKEKIKIKAKVIL